ncbi:MAG: transposase [Planctomycetaceae bacterium]|nr:transposase [Planctomycetaceae bacterium]
MPHRKRIKHFHEPGHLHELTFSTYQQKPLLTNDDWREKLARSIDTANQTCRFQLVAFVFMPEHLHLLTNPLDDEPEFGKYLASIKQPFSKQVKSILVENHSRLLKQLTVRERPGKSCFRFWQEGAGYDRNVYSKEVILHSINDIHENPVRRGLCRNPIEWKWSSARYDLNEPPQEQEPDFPLIHGIPTGALD